MVTIFDTLLQAVNELNDLCGIEAKDYPKATYQVEIVEVRKRIVPVEMNVGSYNEAKGKVQAMYKAGEIAMDSESIAEVEVNVDEIIYEEANDYEQSK